MTQDKVQDQKWVLYWDGLEYQKGQNFSSDQTNLHCGVEIHRLDLERLWYYQIGNPIP